MKLSTRLQMKELDRLAIEKYNIPDIILMENASLGALNCILKEFGNVENKKIAVFAGLGNNGGDALAISRHLHNANAKVMNFLFAKKERLNASLATNYRILESAGVPIVFVENISDVNDTFLANADIIIDGLFGIGLSRNVEGLFCKVIEKMNISRAFKVALDIPSGINADTGEIMGIAFKAHITPTFALAKPGHFLYPAREYCGKVIVVNISTPKIVLDEFKANYYALTKEDFCVPERPRASHKGNFGHVAIVGGSLGKSGAVILASLASLKMGSGLVTAVLPKSINSAFESLCLEAMSYPVDDNNGFFSKQSISQIIEFVKDKDAIAFGMGLGVYDEALDILQALLELKKPVLIDADGLNVLAKNIGILKNKTSQVILTPHPKEFSRLINQSTSYVLKNRLNLVREFAKNYNLTLVLKTADTLISDGENIFINTSGNSGLSTGGSGDVLSGIIVSLLGQGFKPEEAAKLGVFLHGFSADLASKRYSYQSLLPSNVIDYLNEAILDFTKAARSQ